eukprot:Phypoly_transcript_04788.p1 GENE.Phypoly_transcript_04788~~Phypoly_transcript_04788.p1  ORF type:complete len:291 (+),score=48.59 Phypoly_transcript_04788:131-1003(+)
MYYSKLFKALLALGAVVVTANGATIYPKSLQTQKGSNSDVSLSALASKDQSKSQDSWDKYVEFYGSSEAYEGIFTFDTSNIDASSVGSYSLDVNFKGPKSNDQTWTFEFKDPATGNWIAAGDNSDADSWKWTSLSFCGGDHSFASLVSNGNIQVRMTSSKGDDCDLDYLAITTTDGTSTTPTDEPTDAPTERPTPRPSTAPTERPTKAPKPTPKPLRGGLQELVGVANIAALPSLPRLQAQLDHPADHPADLPLTPLPVQADASAPLDRSGPPRQEPHGNGNSPEPSTHP